MRELSKFETFFKDIWIELSQKMTWPSRKQLIDMTAVVIIFVVIWALYVGVLDFAFAKGFEKFLQFAQLS
jgi:preprotein translocase subunit SecE